MKEPTCSNCGSKMHEGFIIDQTYGAQGQAQWSQGPPQRSFWTGIKIAKDARHPVTTYRCQKCGYLESYALTPG